MKLLSKSAFGCYAGVTITALLSFFLFSYNFYPFFNSDSALAVLMAYDYHLPQDIYCWGQDRGGTFEMMITHFFISVFHANPLVAASIIHYLILTAGLLAAFHFIRKPLTRLALSIAWFFPSRFFLETILYQFGTQFSLFVIAIYFFSKATSSQKKYVFISLSWLFMLLSCWVLDLGLVPAAFLILFIPFTMLMEKRLPGILYPGIRNLWNRKIILISLLWVALGISFIAFAKHSSRDYHSDPEALLNDAHGIYAVLASITNSIVARLLPGGKLPECIYLYALIIFLIIFFKRYGKQGPVNFFSTFFLWQSVFGILFLMFLKQLLTGQVPARYFADSYFSFIVFIFMTLDKWDTKSFALKLSLFAVLTCSVFSTGYENFLPEKLPPMVKNFESLNRLKPVGIIGSYWHSYLFAAIDPAMIKATPHEQDYVRNRELALQALSQPRILLIQNDWLMDFPDSISQFGTMLVKKGNPFLLGRYVSWEEHNPVMACEYKTTP